MLSNKTLDENQTFDGTMNNKKKQPLLQMNNSQTPINIKDYNNP